MCNDNAQTCVSIKNLPSWNLYDKFAFLGTTGTFDFNFFFLFFGPMNKFWNDWRRKFNRNVSDDRLSDEENAYAKMSGCDKVQHERDKLTNNLQCNVLLYIIV